MQITSNIGDISKMIKNFESKQIDYAAKVALNNTAEIAMSAGVKKIAKDFKITAAWNKVGGKYGLRKKSATKDKQYVEIFIPDANTWIRDHENGSIRAGTQLIPTKYFKSLYPKAITNAQIKAKAKTLLKNQSKNRIFRSKISGNEYFMQRKKGKQKRKNTFGKFNKKGKAIRSKAGKVDVRVAFPLFLIAKDVQETKKLEFYNTINSEFNKNLNKEFFKALEYAMKTAK